MRPFSWQRVWAHLTNLSPILVLGVTMLIGLLAINLTQTAEEFLEDNYLHHQRTRGIIKTNLLVERGLGKAITSLALGKEDMVNDALDQLDAARSFLATSVYSPVTSKEEVDRRIKTLAGHIESLQEAVHRGEPLDATRIEALHAEEQRIFAQLAAADNRNWTDAVVGSSQRHEDLHGLYIYFTLLCIFLIAVSGLLTRTLQRRRQAERALRLSNATLEKRVVERTEELQQINTRLGQKSTQLQTILDTIPAPIFYKDHKGIYLGCNEAFEHYIGLSREKVVGSTVYDVAPPDLANIYHRADLDLMAKGGTQVYEASVQYADGSRHEVIFHKAVITDADGSASGLVGAMLDITGRKQAEKALKAGEKRFRSIIESSPMGIALFQLDDEERIVLHTANPAAESILGTPRGDLNGKTMEEVLPLVSSIGLSEIAPEICLHGAQWSTSTAPWQNRDKQGVLEIHAFQTTPGQMAVFLSDVTEKKRQEDLLVKAAKGVSAHIGDDFFFSLARHLSEVLGADYVITGELSEGDSPTIDTIAIWEKGGALDNVPYDCERTPCRDVLRLGACSYPRDVQLSFPDDHLLKDLDVKAFVGIPLRRMDGSSLGVLAVLFREPLDKEKETVSLLKIFGARAAAEIERRHADRTLQESEERFRSMFQTSPDAVVLVRLANRRIVEINDSYTEQSGYSRTEAIGSNSLELNLWEQPADGEKLYELLERDGIVDNLESRLRRKDGTIVPVLISVRQIQLGNEPHLLIVNRNITEIKAALLALEKSERRYRELSQQFQALLDGISDALVLISPSLEVVWANRGAGKMFGFNDEQLKGMSCTSFWRQNGELCKESISQCFSEGVPSDKMVRTSDGRCWGIKLFPITDKDGRVNNVIQIISDITEKARLREQSTQASRLASLGELAAGVAHEINNPNAQILLNLPMLHEAIEDALPILDEHFAQQGDFSWGGLKYSRMREELPATVEDMLDASKRIKHIVKDLKNFSRQEPGDQMQTLDLNTAMSTAVRLTGNRIKRTTERFELVLAKELPSIRGIQQRIEQVFVNLILNACQALPERNCGLRVETRHDNAKNRIEVIISDEGVGMSEEIQRHATDPFFTTRREVGGTGLGLSICARIVKEHDGEMIFDSTPGKGTTVTLALPTLS